MSLTLFLTGFIAYFVWLFIERAYLAPRRSKRALWDITLTKRDYYRVW